MDKITHLGIKGNMDMFIRYFISNRGLVVRIGKVSSKRMDIFSGVPQGSLISPLLFSIMINDIFDELDNNVHYSLYADDGAMWVTCLDVGEGLMRLQKGINTVLQRCTRCDFELTVTKTKAMIFSRARKFPNLNLKFYDRDIEFIKNYTFLGVILDKQLK